MVASHLDTLERDYPEHKGNDPADSEGTAENRSVHSPLQTGEHYTDSIDTIQAHLQGVLSTDDFDDTIQSLGPEPLLRLP